MRRAGGGREARGSKDEHCSNACHFLVANTHRLLFLATACLDVFNMVFAICVFSIYTSEVFTAFHDNWAPAQSRNVTHIHYGFGWGFSVILFAINFSTAILGFFLVYQADAAAAGGGR